MDVDIQERRRRARERDEGRETGELDDDTGVVTVDVVSEAEAEAAVERETRRRELEERHSRAAAMHNATVHVKEIALDVVGVVVTFDLNAPFFSMFGRGGIGSSTSVSIQLDNFPAFPARVLDLGGRAFGIPAARRGETYRFEKMTVTVLNASASTSLVIVWGDVALLAMP